MLNNVTLMGRLTRDPEIRTTGGDITTTTFSIAVDRDYGKDGKKETDFPTIVAWRNTADFIGKYFRKGSMIVVSGRLQTRSFTDKEGNKRSVTEVVANNVYFGEGKRDNAQGGAPAGGAGDYSAQPAGSYGAAYSTPAGGYGVPAGGYVPPAYGNDGSAGFDYDPMAEGELPY